VPSFHWTRREFLERSLKSGAALTGAVYAFGSHATQGEPAMLATDVQSELKVQLVINGAKHALAVDVRTSLLDLLRERLHLTGTKKVG